MVDLATLTGAIIVSLGSEYAGLFSNDDKLSKQLLEAGEKLMKNYGECLFTKLWQTDKLKNADMQNINYVGALDQLLQHNFYKDLFLIKHLGLIWI